MLRYLFVDIICKRGTDNVQGQISEHIFAPNGGYCLFIFTIPLRRSKMSNQFKSYMLNISIVSLVVHYFIVTFKYLIITDLLRLAKCYQQISLVLFSNFNWSKVFESEISSALLLFSLPSQEAGNSVERAQQGITFTCMYRACSCILGARILNSHAKQIPEWPNGKNYICIAFLLVDFIVLNCYTYHSQVLCS